MGTVTAGLLRSERWPGGGEGSPLLSVDAGREAKLLPKSRGDAEFQVFWVLMRA